METAFLFDLCEYEVGFSSSCAFASRSSWLTMKPIRAGHCFCSHTQQHLHSIMLIFLHFFFFDSSSFPGLLGDNVWFVAVPLDKSFVFTHSFALGAAAGIIKGSEETNLSFDRTGMDRCGEVSNHGGIYGVD